MRYKVVLAMVLLVGWVSMPTQSESRENTNKRIAKTKDMNGQENDVKGFKVSERLVSFVKGFEGCRLVSYMDAKGRYAIGYGHTKDVKPNTAITQAQADKYLKDDLGVVGAFVGSLGISGSQGEFDALTSFVYNIGEANFLSSTLYKRLKRGVRGEPIHEAFMMWVKADGKVLRGLEKRREGEYNVFSKGIYG